MTAAAIEVKDDWVRSAIRAARERARQSTAPAAIWTTSGPYSSIRIGDRLRREFGVPWVADLRDPFSAVSARSGLVRQTVRTVRLPLVRRLRRADLIVAVSPPLAALDASTLRRPVRALPSGYDVEDWRGITPVTDDSHTIVIVMGRLYPGYVEPDLLLSGLALARQESELADRIRVRYFGRDGSLFRSIAERHGVGAWVNDCGFVSATNLRRHILGADGLALLTASTGLGGVPGGKAYEYLASGRPILCIGPRDPFVEELLGDVGTVADSREAVARELINLATTRAAPSVGVQTVADLHTWDDRGRHLSRWLDQLRSGRAGSQHEHEAAPE